MFKLSAKKWSVCGLGLALSVSAWAQTAAKPAAEPKEPEDLYQVGFAAYQKGNFDLAVKKLEGPAVEGNRDALYYLAESVYFHTGRNGHLTQAFNLHKLAAKANDPRSLFRLSQMMAVGVPNAPDINQALQMLRQAAEAGYKPAQLADAAFYKARPLVRDEAPLLKQFEAVMEMDPAAAGTPGHAFGVAPQATCGDVMQAALLSKVANQLYVGYLRELLMDYYGSEPDGVVVRPYLATFYAHVMDADRTLFSTCQISAGVGRDVSTTGRRVNQYGLTELAATADGQASTRWLLPFEPDASAYRLGSEVGPIVFAQQSKAWKACPRGVLLQAVQTANQPDLNKQCLPFEYGMAAATGRSLKVSLPEMKGFTPSRFYPELVVIGQFGKVFYLWQE